MKKNPNIIQKQENSLASGNIIPKMIPNFSNKLLETIILNKICRSKKPEEYPERFPVPDEKVQWNNEYHGYSPSYYIFQRLIGKSYADPEDFNFSRTKKYESHLGEIKIDENGLPLNPIGRTGIKGRGILGKWGPNHAADPIIIRTNKEDVEILLVKRKDTGEWALPGGMTDPGEILSETASRELKEETGKELDLSEAIEIYKGYVDDFRNTDNAWMETSVYLLEIEFTESDDLQFQEKESIDVKWLKISDELFSNLFASHGIFIKKALEFIKKEDF